jgi:hypothetical protein
VKARCPAFSPTRWCHVYLLVVFIVKHYQAIVNSGIALPLELFGFGALIEPIFHLMGQLEQQSARFYMREHKLRCFPVKIDELKGKFDTLPFFEEAANLVSSAVAARFAVENRDLALVADFFAAPSHRSTPDQPPGRVEAFLEALLNNQASTICSRKRKKTRNKRK